MERQSSIICSITLLKSPRKFYLAFPLKISCWADKLTFPRAVPFPGNTNTTGKNSPVPIPNTNTTTNTTTNSAANRFSAQAACTLTPNNPTKFWRETVNLNGASPFNADPTYQVYRNVRIYGAKGDGVTDDSGAFQFAIDGKPLSSPQN